ncbi:MAG TPA: hypothetical protein VLW85_22225 [Myxococcales bacterium]|nr:hypothetical protein [Myxococcales bacterium]
MIRTTFIAAAALACGVLIGSRVARAYVDDRSFVLEERDKIVAEAPGCYAACEPTGARRVCTIRESECHAVCVALPECNAGLATPLRVCALVRDRP